eukprot:TRINITY_DN52150_c0_g1_i1.p1 TRINITY_DN52150_c0_g1~~TRINITY_DN52150_c0_g1_i1.p1  ORF type:complete len:246 (+),score=37.62 TRINITY_DN52150_c0_g1_i1:123-860(+)
MVFDLSLGPRPMDYSGRDPNGRLSYRPEASRPQKGPYSASPTVAATMAAMSARRGQSVPCNGYRTDDAPTISAERQRTRTLEFEHKKAAVDADEGAVKHHGDDIPGLARTGGRRTAFGSRRHALDGEDAAEHGSWKRHGLRERTTPPKDYISFEEHLALASAESSGATSGELAPDCHVAKAAADARAKQRCRARSAARARAAGAGPAPPPFAPGVTFRRPEAQKPTARFVRERHIELFDRWYESV